jgi:uncharacterized damage-inducible protein DinB
VARADRLRELLAYDRSVLEAFERRLKRLPWETVTENVEIGHRTLKDTIVHILNVFEAWFVAVAQKRWEIFDRTDRKPEECRSWADVLAYHRRVWTEVEAFARGLSDRDLARRIRAPWMPGRYTVEDAFFQTSFEQAHHLGEIIGALWQRDIEPPAMTWIERRNRLARPPQKRSRRARRR